MPRELINKVKRQFSSISFKLFVWFWLVTILSVVTTRFISHQLDEQIRLKPASTKELKLAKRIAQRIDTNLDQGQVVNQAQLIKRIGDSSRRKIILKDMSTSELLFKGRHYHDELADYLTNNDFNNPSAIFQDGLRVTGPIQLTLPQGNYQLFIGHFYRKRHFLSGLPPWARIAIPASISFLLCWLLAKSLTRPIVSMQNAARKLGAGDLKVRLDKDCQRGDELGQLACSFNDMADKLNANLGAHQRLLGDVSHELRSPLTRLQIAINLLQRQNQQDEQSNHLARCETEIERLDAMLDDILALSRMEHASQGLEKTSFNLVELIEQVKQDNLYQAETKSITLSYQGSNHGELLSINADRKLIYSALDNIVANAVKYSPQDSQVTLLTEVTKDKLIIKVIDQGEGVPHEQLAHLFEPFFRVSAARDRQTGGTGLGLAIAKQAIVKHQGQITAKNNCDKGLTVQIELPYSLIY